ncbi:hypothetical protein WKW80_33115 [Variovorax humicola]|uniref:Uncharacterized protein n=1 Tax=Variovorax humicola TaxID=1769758 RepID=A0ABU8WA31_9BURK
MVRSYKIEEGSAAPDITLSASRSGDYMVLGGHPVLNKSIASGTITDEIANNGGPDGLIDGTKIKSIVKDNTEVGVCDCIGYMLLKFTWTTVQIVKTKEQPTGKDAKTTAWKVVETKQPVAVFDYLVTTACNVTREPKKTVYSVHNKESKGGQVHVEQICAHRLRAFLLHLKAVGGAKAPTFNFKDLTVKGFVKFRGKAKSGGALTVACNGCEGVWTDLRKDCPFLEDVKLAQD